LSIIVAVLFTSGQSSGQIFLYRLSSTWASRILLPTVCGAGWLPLPPPALSLRWSRLGCTATLR